MNNSVASYAPKNKVYSKSSSLETRVSIAAATRVIGHASLSSRIFLLFGNEIDGNLENILKREDIGKEAKANCQKRKEAKLKRDVSK